MSSNIKQSNINQEKKEERNQHLFNIITDEKFYSGTYFRLMNNEAASGKSVTAFKALAWLGVNTDYKVIYVQTFANEVSEENDGIELKKTVGTINSNAKKDVANYLSIRNSNKHSEIIEKYNILCITHNKYYNLCKESRNNLIDKADILIIDEFPNLYEEFKIGREELETLKGKTLYSSKQERTEIESIVIYLRDLLETYKKQYKPNEINIINLHKQRNKNRVKILKRFKNKSKDKEVKQVCDGMIELLSHGSIYNNNNFYTYNSKAKYKLAKKHNVILDANAGFDMRYKLKQTLFKLDNQAKVFDYSNSELVHYPVKTTKTKLKSYIDILGDTIEYINKNVKHNGCLIVSDKERVDSLTQAQKQLHEAPKLLYFTYYGNFIGKNEWGSLDTVWSVKTPYYNFYQYILMYMFYSGTDLNGNTSCKYGNKSGENYQIFYNEDFDKFKNSIVAGEIYQATKRIARDGRDCSINIVIDNPEIIQLVKSQFANIKLKVNENIKFREKETKARANRRLKKERYTTILSKHMESGLYRLEKQKFADEINVSIGNLSRELRVITEFLINNNIEIGKGRDREYLIFKDNIKENVA